MTPTEAPKIEYRVVPSFLKPDAWSAQLRFAGSDETLRQYGIAPGWHTFKTSKSQARVEAAVALDKANREAA